MPGMSDIREQEQAALNAVLSSRTLAKCQNLARLLQYICQKYLEGDASNLKEYNIGVEALGRALDFDPTENSIVRVEVHRLREKFSRRRWTSTRTMEFSVGSKSRARPSASTPILYSLRFEASPSRYFWQIYCNSLAKFWHLAKVLDESTALSAACSCSRMSDMPGI